MEALKKRLVQVGTAISTKPGDIHSILKPLVHCQVTSKFRSFPTPRCHSLASFLFLSSQTFRAQRRVLRLQPVHTGLRAGHDGRPRTSLPSRVLQVLAVRETLLRGRQVLPDGCQHRVRGSLNSNCPITGGESRDARQACPEGRWVLIIGRSES